jgi:hypothetical protein
MSSPAWSYEQSSTPQHSRRDKHAPKTTAIIHVTTALLKTDQATDTQTGHGLSRRLWELACPGEPTPGPNTRVPVIR